VTAGTDAASIDQQRPWVDAAHLFALCGFAVAQPLFDLLGNNPTFFVAHDLDGFDLVLFALALVVVPPIVLLAVLLAVRLVSVTAARVVRAVMVGVLVALTLLPPVERTLGLSTAAWVVVGLVAGTAAAFAYDRLRLLRTFASFLAAAPVLFLVVFLFVSPAHTLLGATDPAAAALDLQGTQTPVVLVAFDELPTGVLLDESGRIDAARFPGFARLARTSTWYPNATTVALQTHVAIPAILTGQVPEGTAVPIASAHPRSLFTLLGRSHRLHASESVTEICPESLCRLGRTRQPTASLADDLEIVYAHSALPDSLAREWLPEIDNRWSGFGADAEAIRPKPTDTTTGDGDFFDEAFDEHDVALETYQAFLASIDDRDREPGLWFVHSLLPHAPYRWLPDGRVYSRDRGTPGFQQQGFVHVWTGERDVVAAGLQRLVLQTKLVDRLVERLLDRLSATGMLDDALVVVTADHGAVFVPNEPFRGNPLAEESKHHVLPVPLFVKYPGQATAEVDGRDARTSDIVPTIADAFDVDLPAGWSFEGRSLRGEPRTTETHEVLEDPGAEEVRSVRGPIEPSRLTALVHEYLGAGGRDRDGFRFGPYGALVGEDAAALGAGDPTGAIEADDWAAFDDVDLRGQVPALFEGTVEGVDPGGWLAVALNGIVAGLGPAYRGPGGATRAVVMLDPTLLRPGANRVDVYRVDAEGPTLRPLTRR
jgi:hypothetical protein